MVCTYIFHGGQQNYENSKQILVQTLLKKRFGAAKKTVATAAADVTGCQARYVKKFLLHVRS
jgi:hypothetical protein